MFYFYIMSPPTIWGPAVWTLFHTLAEKINPNAYESTIHSMFYMFVRICKYLPCPECSKDASRFLAKINLTNYKTKNEFKNMLYLFHNWVNSKKGKSLFNYANMNKYNNLNLVVVINNFIDKYNTKGNMSLLAESFQRTLVVKDFISWFKSKARAFVKPMLNVEPNIQTNIEANVEANIPANIETNVEPILEPNIPANIETNVEPILEPNIPANIETNVEPNIPANIETNVEPNIQTNVEPIL